MKRLIVVAALVASGCASLGGARHVSTVGLVTAHSVLSAVQDTETRIVCGRPNAPQAPLCVPIQQHQQISGYLEKAFTLEVQAATIVRGLPVGSIQPVEVVTIVAEINTLVQQALALFPDGQDKSALVQSIGGQK